LLESGLWSRTRNPNYLGELCIYLAFATLSLHWLPFVFFGSVIAIEWVPNMRRKDASLSRYPAFAAYKARSGLLFPKLF
jgi:steroid 5-alpha reductase family enzyme